MICACVLYGSRRLELMVLELCYNAVIRLPVPTRLGAFLTGRVSCTTRVTATVSLYNVQCALYMDDDSNGIRH